MARKRDTEVKTAMEGWLTGDGPDTADAPDLDTLALYRRAGVDDELIAMAQNGRAWRVPDRAGGWSARSELANVAGHGLTRLGAQAEARARARIADAAVGSMAPGADAGGDSAPTSTGSTPADPDRAELIQRASETARAAYGTTTPTPEATVDPAGGARGDGLTRQAVTYLTAAESEALAARARADRRSVSFVVRDAIRAYLGMQ